MQLKQYSGSHKHSNELISCKNISLYYYFFLLLLFPSYNDAESCYRHLLCPVATSSGPYNGDYEFELFLLNDWLGYSRDFSMLSVTRAWFNAFQTSFPFCLFLSVLSYSLSLSSQGQIEVTIDQSKIGSRSSSKDMWWTRWSYPYQFVASIYRYPWTIPGYL